jgi:hypothetical protein
MPDLWYNTGVVNLKIMGRENVDALKQPSPTNRTRGTANGYSYHTPTEYLLHFAVGRIMAHRLTTSTAIERFCAVHGDRYDYSQVEYVSTSALVRIGCRAHGWFYQSPNSHISQRAGCPKCAAKTRAGKHQWDTGDFIEKARAVHGERYDYSAVEYRNSQEKVSILCSVHGAFLQRPAEHARGKGCSKCQNDASRMQTIDFVERATALNGERYDYSGVVLSLSVDRVLIRCLVHGDFRQVAIEHLRGKQCPACAHENARALCKSHHEEVIGNLLASLGIEFQRQKTFLKCRHIRPLPFDFYFTLGGLHFLVEYDGAQHFGPVDFFGGEKEYQLRVKKDAIKTAFAEANSFVLIRIPYTKNECMEAYLQEELLKYA